MKATPKTTHGTPLPADDPYNLFFYNHPLPMWVYDRESLAFLDVNTAAVEKYGYSRDEFLQLSIKDIQPAEEDVARLLVDVKKKRPSLQHSGEWHHLHKDGHIIDVEITSLIIEFNGRKAVLAIAHDVTEPKRVSEALLQSEAFHRTLLENVQVGVGIAESSGKLVTFNAAMLQPGGYTRADIEKISSVTDLYYDPQDRTRVMEIMARQGSVNEFPIQFKRKDGSPYDTLLSLCPVQYLGKPCIQAVVQDITARKRAEHALLHSQQETTHANRLLLALSQAAQAVQRAHTIKEVYQAIQEQITKLGYNATGFEFTPDGQSLWIVYLNYNPKLVHMGEKLAKISLREYHFRPRMDSIYHRAIVKGEAVFDNNGAQAVADTLPKSLSKLARPMVDLFKLGPSIFAPLRVAEETIGVLGITGPDLTEADNLAVNAFACQAAIALQNARLNEQAQQEIYERKQAEEGLQESKELLDAFIRHSPIYAFIKEVTPTESRVLKASENYQDMVGLPGSDMVGKSMKELFPAKLAAKITADDWEVVSAGKVLRLDEDLNGRNYTTVKFPIILGDKNMLAGYTIDITDRKRAEDALRLLSTRQEAILSAVPDILMEVNNDKIYTWANPAGFEFFGEDVIGKEAAFYFEGEQETYEIVEPIFNGKQNLIYVESWQLRKDGEKRLLAWWCRVLTDAAGNVTGALSSGHDITERKQAEEALKEYNTRLETAVQARTRELRETQEQLVRQEKLAVLGQLAGGVGHELRNPLAVINNAVYFLKLTQQDKDDKVKEYLSMIEKETHTAEKIITDLLDFARSISVEREPVSVQDLVQGVLQRYPKPPTVAVSLRIPAGLPNVFIDRRQLEQVLGNLVINAFQAMPQGGALSLSAKKKGREVLLLVVDTGVGIPPENMKKLFEPLFTTKLKGIGLGLAVSRKLVEANSGRIEVQSKPGAGSTFTLCLPIEEGQLG